MFGSSLPTVVCMRAHVLFTLFVFVCIKWHPTHIVLCFSSSIVPYVASFSGLLIFDYIQQNCLNLNKDNKSCTLTKTNCHLAGPFFCKVCDFRSG